MRSLEVPVVVRRRVRGWRIRAVRRSEIKLGQTKTARTICDRDLP